uniref:Uncharacterized protein n=1 Tax=Nothobranchius furzeri TaxID=105023 RepID=A0A8C6P885_NOTFU
MDLHVYVFPAEMAISADHLRDKLTKELAAVHVDVEDTSSNRCATSFKVLIVSSQFEGKPLLQRHRYHKHRTSAHPSLHDHRVHSQNVSANESQLKCNAYCNINHHQSCQEFQTKVI